MVETYAAYLPVMEAKVYVLTGNIALKAVGVEPVVVGHSLKVAMSVMSQ